ncbi:methyl-accepting chemotaxis protein [Chitinimonas naiadis]
MNKLSITHKLLLGFGIIIALMIALAVSTGTSLEKFNHTTETRLQNLRTLDHADKLYAGLALMAAHIRQYALTGDITSLQRYQQASQEEQALLQQTHLGNNGNAAIRQPLAEAQRLIDQWVKHYAEPLTQLRQAVDAGRQDRSALSQWTMDHVQDATIQPLSTQLDLIVREVTAANQALKVQDEALRSVTLRILVIGAVLGTLIALVTSLTIARTIAQRLEQAIIAADAVSQGDLSKRIPVDGNDEISVLLHAICRMQEKLLTTVREILESADEVGDSARQIVVNADQIYAGARDQSSSAQAMATAVKQLTTSIGDIANSAGTAHALSREAGHLSSEGAEVIREAMGNIGEIADSVLTASDDMEQLGRQTVEIANMISVIKEIADQTNLLALNATIEAARAGENGRGFVVVADEVRRLADKTTHSTQQISRLIEQILAGSHHVQGRMRESVRKVEQGVAKANAASATIVAIRAGSDKVQEAVTDISSSLSEQSVASSDASSSVQRIAQMTVENSLAAEASNHSARQLGQLAMALKQSVQFFKLA